MMKWDVRRNGVGMMRGGDDGDDGKNVENKILSPPPLVSFVVT